MSNDFSLMGYESVPVAEYLPILENIKHDLNYIYEKFITLDTLSGSLNLNTLQTGPNANLIKSNNDASVNTDSIEYSSLHVETQQAEKLNKINLLIPKNLENLDSDSSLDVVDRVKNYVESKENHSNCSVSENNSLKEEMLQYKQQIKEKESIINELNDEIEQSKEELKGKNGKIQNLKTQIQDLQNESSSKDEKHENINKSYKSAKEELAAKEEQISKLMEDNKKLEAKQSPSEKKAELPNPEMKRTLEEKIQRITELEAKIDNFQSKETENSENIGRIQELENKIRQLQMQNEVTNDENYKELLEGLKSKRAELRERDKVITELESNISDNENQIRKLEREIRILKKKADENTQELKECESIKDEYEGKYKLLKKELKQCKSKYDNEEDLQKYFDEIKGLKESLKSRENSIKEKDKIIEEHKQKVVEFQEKLKDKNKSFDVEIEKRKIEIEKQNKKIEAFEKEVETLKGEGEKKQQAIVNMREKIKSSNEGKIDQSEVKKLQNLTRAKDMEIEQLHSKVENLNVAFDKKCTEYELANKKTIQLQSEIDNMKKLNFGATKKENPPKPPENPFPPWWSKHMNK